jgi:hypothetical protein
MNVSRTKLVALTAVGLFALYRYAAGSTSRVETTAPGE